MNHDLGVLSLNGYKDMSVSSFLATGIIPSNLQDVCQCCLDIVSNASSHQINAAIKYNQQEINKLLIQLLTINFVKQNKETIQNETKQLQKKNNNNHQLENYCNQKLLEISPIHGFSPKPYFLDYKVSDDIRMEILTYLKPIELFKTIRLLNKQFNKNVERMHESTNDKYSRIFEISNFTFDSFLEMEEYCNSNKRKGLHDGRVYVDWMSTNGYWYHGPVTNINPFDGYISASSTHGPTASLHHARVAPYRSMFERGCNTNRFKNTIIKRGYCSQGCDININKFSFVTSTSISSNSNVLFDITRGFVHGDCIDIWVCGKINFDYTLENTWVKTQDENGYLTFVLASKYDEYAQMHPGTVMKSLKVLQVGVNVDITRYYNQYTHEERTLINSRFKNVLLRSGDRYILTVFVHGDDTSSIRYFGSKSSIDDRNEMIQDTYRFAATSVSDAKKKFLDLIGYPNYYSVTPEGSICRLENEKKFNKWYWRWYQCGLTTPLFDSGFIQTPIGDLSKKIFYKQEKDELHLKYLFKHLWLVFVDNSVSVPFKNTYAVLFSSSQRPRLIDAVITDPRLTNVGDSNKDEMKDRNTDGENIKLNKKEIYCQRLKKWQGFVKCTFDITQVFDEFQERLRDEWNEYHANNNNINNNKDNNDNSNKANTDDNIDEYWFCNRRYFTNFNRTDMPYLKWERETNRITYDYYFDHAFLDCNFELSISQRLGIYNVKLLSMVFSYADAKDVPILRCVCHNWNHILPAVVHECSHAYYDYHFNAFPEPRTPPITETSQYMSM